MGPELHSFSRGHVFLFRQLQFALVSLFGSCWMCFCRVFVLCAWIMVLMLGVQLYEILTQFLLTIFLRLWFGGKCLSIS